MNPKKRHRWVNSGRIEYCSCGAKRKMGYKWSYLVNGKWQTKAGECKGKSIALPDAEKETPSK